MSKTRIANTRDGWEILKVLGFSDDRKIIKAVITIEVGLPVYVSTEEFGEMNAEGDGLEIIRNKYEVVKREEPTPEEIEEANHREKNHD